MILRILRIFVFILIKPFRNNLFPFFIKAHDFLADRTGSSTFLPRKGPPIVSVIKRHWKANQRPIAPVGRAAKLAVQQAKATSRTGIALSQYGRGSRKVQSRLTMR